MTLIEALHEFWPELSLTVFIFAVLLLVIRFHPGRTKAAKSLQTAGSRPVWHRFWQAIGHAVKLAGFALLALTLVLLSIMMYRVNIGLNKDFAPTPSRVGAHPDLGAALEDVSFTAEDGVQIEGWYAPSENGATIILLHGSGGNRTGMNWHARQLATAGYGVLMYDERASGESGGTHRSYGWEDPLDVRAAVQFLNGRGGASPDKLGILGCSLGGQIALQGAAYNPDILAVWADGPGTVRAQDVPPQHNVLVQLVVAGNYMMDWASEIELKMQAPAPLIEIIDDISPRPVMLVGSGIERPLIGSEGDFITFYASYAGDNTQVWVIPEAPHCAGPAVRSQEYAERMIGFFDTAFSVERR